VNELRDLTSGTGNLIVGSGAGGSVVFEKLTGMGEEALLIEEGPDILGMTPFDIPIIDRHAKFYRDGGFSPILSNRPFPFSEGRVLGGTSELNGGLFWPLPEILEEKWISNLGYMSGDIEDLKNHFLRFSNLLRVGPVATEANSDLPSKLLRDSAEKQGLAVEKSMRLVPECQKLNQCGSGCPKSLKNSMSRTLIPIGVKRGGRYKCEVRALRINAHSGVARSLQVKYGNSNFEIPFKRLFLSCGPTQTPLLLHRSKLTRKAGKIINFHLNLKFLVKFKEDINAKNGTIFSHQVQEYLNEGILLMTSNFQPEYLGIILANLSKDQIQDVLQNLNRYAIFTLQLNPKDPGRLHFFGDRTVASYRFSNEGLQFLKSAISKVTNLLFSMPIKEMVLPIGNFIIDNPRKIEDILNASKASDFYMSSVHGMSSASFHLNDKLAVTDRYGKLLNYQNVFIADSSAVPTATIESPQGTIMSFVAMSLER